MALRRLLQSRPCNPTSLSAKLLPVATPVEEEHTPHYKPQHFYPVRLYEILNNRYQIAAKIGWGTSSTVWLARDLYHPGGRHICMVFDPLCEPLWMLKHRFKGKTIPIDVLKAVSKVILEGLRYLHTECHIIHTDLKSDNILMALGNPAILHSIAQDEMNSPSPRKELEDRMIYLSRNQWNLQPEDLGRTIITDFGLAVHGDGPPNNHPIQPDGYRAPEVSLGAEWSYSVDIWNMGVLLWDLFQGSGPFDIPRSEYSEEAHLARIISLLGAPPPDLQRGKNTFRYFDDQGQFRFPDLVGKIDLESMANDLDGDEKSLFIQFILRMLRWKPEDRASVDDLLSDPWFQSIDL
ncbi:kinase-like domain-containing protein [Aspergillus californicus]